MSKGILRFLGDLVLYTAVSFLAVPFLKNGQAWRYGLIMLLTCIIAIKQYKHGLTDGGNIIKNLGISDEGWQTLESNEAYTIKARHIDIKKGRK